MTLKSPVRFILLTAMVWGSFSPISALPKDAEPKVVSVQEGTSSSSTIPDKSNQETKKNKFEMFSLNTENFHKGSYNVGGKSCKIKGIGAEECLRYMGAWIGNAPIQGLRAKFEDGKLLSMSGFTEIAHFSSVSDAFTLKYGAPKSVENPTWKNQMGTSFDNVKQTWIFVDGVMILEARTFRSDISTFGFVSYNEIAKPKEKIPENF